MLRLWSSIVLKLAPQGVTIALILSQRQIGLCIGQYDRYDICIDTK